MPLKKEFVEKVSALCKEKDLLLMIDEVQTGAGRTGSFTAMSSMGSPRMWSPPPRAWEEARLLAPACAPPIWERCWAPVCIGTTFGGNPVACAGGLEVLQRVANDEFYNQ